MKKFLIISTVLFLLSSCTKDNCCIRELEILVDVVEYGHPRFNNTDLERIKKQYAKFNSPGYITYINALPEEEKIKVSKLKERYNSIMSRFIINSSSEEDITVLINSN